jgi:hypothetical protein
MFGQSGKDDAQLALAKRMIKQWVRERFSLAEDATVMTTQLDCAEPGCPPHETVIAFWDMAQKRHQFKILRSAAEVAREDVFRLGDPAQFPLPNHPHNHN